VPTRESGDRRGSDAKGVGMLGLPVWDSVWVAAGSLGVGGGRGIRYLDPGVSGFAVYEFQFQILKFFRKYLLGLKSYPCLRV